MRPATTCSSSPAPALEASRAAVANILSPGERTLVVTIGVFGDRLAEIATAYGADVVRLGFPYGSAADPDKVRETLRAEPSVNTVFLTHNETSTGVTNDLETLAGIIKGEFDKTLVVDGISSIGSIPCPVDAWGIDVAVSGSQKGWMAPPGLAMVSVNQRAWGAVERATMPRYYLDLALGRDSLAKGQTPWTPAITTLYGLRVGLELMLAEGLEHVHRRHARIGSRMRRVVLEMGLELFADPALRPTLLPRSRSPRDWSGRPSPGTFGSSTTWCSPGARAVSRGRSSASPPGLGHRRRDRSGRRVDQVRPRRRQRQLGSTG